METPKSDEEPQIPTHAQLERIWEICRINEDYLIRQEDQSIGISRGLIGFSGISVFPVIFSQIDKSKPVSFILLLFSVLLLIVGFGVGFVDLTKKRMRNALDLDATWKYALKQKDEEERFTAALIDEYISNIRAWRRSEDSRIKNLKYGYLFYGLALLLLALAFLLR